LSHTPEIPDLQLYPKIELYPRVKSSIDHHEKL